MGLGFSATRYPCRRGEDCSRWKFGYSCRTWPHQAGIFPEVLAQMLTKIERLEAALAEKGPRGGSMKSAENCRRVNGQASSACCAEGISLLPRPAVREVMVKVRVVPCRMGLDSEDCLSWVSDPSFTRHAWPSTPGLSPAHHSFANSHLRCSQMSQQLHHFRCTQVSQRPCNFRCTTKVHQTCWKDMLRRPHHTGSRQ